MKWSPEQISGRLSHEGNSTVSYETIYQHVYSDYRSGGRLFANLRFGHRKRKPRFPRRNRDRRGIIQNARSIEERPKSANNRSCYGHWERDTMFGQDKRNSVLILADRKSRYLKLGKLSRRTDHEKLTADLNLPVFFCHPYSSSERGTVENRIGVLRQYLPKGTNLKYLKHVTLKNIERDLNTRPMKCLDWRTPYEVLYGTKVALTT